MKTTIGGDRLGSGNKQEVSLNNYERSTHDLGYVWRSSMSSGTLVPFMSKLALPGDKWEIDLNTDVLTLPTIGPLFGSYKVQLDVFEVPIRLYNAKLHMNKLGVGMDMKSIFLPQIDLYARNPNIDGGTPSFSDNEQINASALVKYLGISGLGSFIGGTSDIHRQFNAVPLLAYWDIYKNYYSNKQEEIGYYIHTDDITYAESQTPIKAVLYTYNFGLKGDCLEPATVTINTNDHLVVYYGGTAKEPDPQSVAIYLDSVGSDVSLNFTEFTWNPQNNTLLCAKALASTNGKVLKVSTSPSVPKNSPKYYFGLKQFPLENIDKMREKLLQYTGSDAYVISPTELEPYSASMQFINLGGVQKYYSAVFSQESLGIKTYQSDLFNNWISTEWIDGAGGISELTAVDTSTGEFTIDALNIASKVYDMLNRIAISGGTFDDWLEAVYTHERVKGVENPVYCGSLIKELAFEEVVSLAETTGSTGNKAPLGTLAGRGRLTGKHKGGKINITINEPSYIISLVSITPRIDYSQGNDFDVNLKTFDDFHKPALDGIGFQDLITEQLLWSDTQIDVDDNMAVYQFSLGKQPSWINYMTSVNKTFGAFAERDNSMFMTLNRRYETKTVQGYGGKLKDGTTYIDPTKFNNIFAEVALDSQNFWVQIACDIKVRRKMSAKIIPNL